MVISTILYILATNMMGMEPIYTLAIYIVGLTTIKGLFSETLKDVFNYKSSKVLYSEIGLKDSLSSFTSLLLIFMYFLYYYPEQLNLIGIGVSVFNFVLIYRFIFWNIKSISIFD